MTVIKAKGQREARALAQDEGLRHGHSFIKGGWFVGTAEELEQLDIKPEPVPRVFRVWGTVAYFCNVEAEDAERAIAEALDPQHTFDGWQEQEWTACDHPARPGSLAYIYECAPCDDQGYPEPEPVSPGRKILSASMRALALEHMPTIRRRAQLAGCSDHEALSSLISHLETLRASASLSGVTEEGKEPR